MSLKTKVKAGNITNLSDARYCAGMGVDWLSFPAEKVNPVKFKEITDWVTGPQFVLEAEALENSMPVSDYSVSTLQISYSQLSWINEIPDKEWMVTIRLSDWIKSESELLAQKKKIIQLIVTLDDTPNQQALLAYMRAHFQVLIEFNSAEQSLNEMLSLPADGINISGSNELKPGLKDFDALSSVLEELEIAD
jgi:phosphoribosylanthranilate isomerase